MRTRNILGLILLLATAACLLAGNLLAEKKTGSDSSVRSVQGSVSDPGGNVVSGAVVQLKNTKTLQIRSFITKEHGDFYFSGLSSDVDYELRAESNGKSSATRTLSSFDSRKQAVLNLTLK